MEPQARKQMWISNRRESRMTDLIENPFKWFVCVACAAGLVSVFTGCHRSGSVTATNAPSASAKESSPQSAPISSASAMVHIAAGKFIMGDKDEVDAPPHEVSLSAFDMDRNLVTQELYQKVMGTNPSRWKGANNPVEQLRWSD